MMKLRMTRDHRRAVKNQAARVSVCEVMESRLLLSGQTPHIKFDPSWLAKINAPRLRETDPGIGVPIDQVGVGANPNPAAPALGTGWDAVNFDTNGTYNGFYYIPPDPIAAAGPNDAVNVVNSTIQWYSKSGTLENAVRLGRNSSGSIAGSFFEPLAPITGTYDPKVLYDQYNGRFVVVALEQTDTANGDASNTSRILIAVSDDSNPAGTWYCQSIDAKTTISGTDYWCDYPGLAIGPDAIYVTGNMFGFGGGSFGGSRLWIIGKSGLYSGSSGTVAEYDPSTAAGLPSEAFTLQPSTMFGATPGTTGTFLVSSGWTSGSTEYVSVIRVNSPLSSPTFSNTMVNVGNISTTFTPASAPQLGTTQTIDSGDGRIYNAVWRNNNLYFANVISPPSDVDKRTCTAHWYRVQADFSSIALADQGDVSGEDIATGTRTFYPAIMVDSAGNMGIGFAASGPNIYPGAYYSGRLSTDPAGTLQSSGTLQAGVDYYYRTFGGTRNRWGDYSGLALDPADGTTFWVYNEYARTRGVSSGGDGRWGTRYGTFSLVSATPGTPTLDAAYDTGRSATDGVTNLNNSSAIQQLQFTVPGTISGALVEVLADGVVIGSTTASGASTTVLTNGTTTLVDGARAITARQTELSKSVSSGSSALTITIDTAPPAAPAVSSITTDTGVSATDGITSDQTLLLGGTSEPIAILNVTQVGTGLIGAATASSGGTWTFDYTGTVLPQGQYQFTATATDVAGNQSAASAPYAVTIDTAAPTTTASVAGTAGINGWYTSGVTVTLNPADASSGVTQTLYSLDGTTWLSYSGAFDVASQGSTTVQFYSTDVAGNVQGTQTQTFKIDSIAPTVTAVYMMGSTWTSGFLSFLASNIGSSSSTYGFAIPVGSGSTQLQTLPWRNINRISVAFSEDVSVAQAQFAIAGSVGSYSVSGFSYNATNHVATWSLSAVIGPDKLYIALPGSGATPVTDVAGNLLDGEWTNPTSFSDVSATSTFPSGNGVAGGDFAFRFDVLPGDSTGGSLGKVNVADVAQTKSRSSLPETASSYRSDVDGNNLINVADVAYVKSKSSIYSLPVDPPVLPSGFSMSLLLTQDGSLLM